MILPRRLILAGLAGIAMSDIASAQYIGPSSSSEPYPLPSRAGVITASLLTAGDTIGGYRMVGIPDGLGAFYDNPGDPNFNLTMNHELGAADGIVRAHGSKGAFVSRWSIEKSSLRVLSGRDHLTSPSNLNLWNGSSYTTGTTAFDRFCSADMPAVSAFYNAATGKGTQNRIHLNGEETSPPFAADHGRAMAHIVTGTDKDKSFQLPRLGRASIENALASPFAQDKTIVMVNDDASVDTNITTSTVCRTLGQSGCASPPSEAYMYVGTKQATGNDIDKAGLTNGTLYGLRVKVGTTVVTGENMDFVFNSATPAVTSARFEFANLGDVSAKTGVQQEDDSINAQVTQFMRIEDGAWDPRPGKERDYYFVTTGRISATNTWRASRLWRLRFDDIANPENGGTITMLLSNGFYPGAATTPDNDPTYQMFDNMAIDSLGRIVLLEDVGNNARRGRVYIYGIESGQLVQVSEHNPKFFGGTSGTNPNFLTADEESSGVIDASAFLGDGWFLLVVQNHKASADPELFEGGQLLALFIEPSIAQPASSPLAAAVLPSSRSVQVGNTASAFATIVNTGPAATSCGIAPASPVPASFSFQTTNSTTNLLSGTANTRVSIAAGGSQSFLISFLANSPMISSDVVLEYSCSGIDAARTIVGVNTLRLTIDANPVPDMIAVGLTPTNDGYAHTGGPGGTGLFVLATTNIGITAPLTARVRLSNAALPLTATVCQTNSTTGACLAPAAATVTATINQNSNATWAAFLQAGGAIPLDAAQNRVFFEFVDANGVVRGSTSTGVTTQ
jgi:hypothetical protein